MLLPLGSSATAYEWPKLIAVEAAAAKRSARRTGSEGRRMLHMIDCTGPLAETARLANYLVRVPCNINWYFNSFYQPSGPPTAEIGPADGNAGFKSGAALHKQRGR